MLDSIKREAEDYFAKGDLYCSEAVLYTINKLLGFPYSEDVVKLASGFPVGMGGKGCLCGAVSGGQMALGMVYGREYGQQMPEEMFPLAAELHDYTMEVYGSNCCRVITKKWADNDFESPKREKLCIEITGKITHWVANKLIEDGIVKLD